MFCLIALSSPRFNKIWGLFISLCTLMKLPKFISMLIFSVNFRIYYLLFIISSLCESNFKMVDSYKWLDFYSKYHYFLFNDANSFWINSLKLWISNVFCFYSLNLIMWVLFHLLLFPKRIFKFIDFEKA